MNNFIYAGDTTLMAESKEELKSLLMRVKEERKSWLKAQHKKKNNQDHGIWSHNFMANRKRKSGSSDRFFFPWTPKSLQMVTATMKLQDARSLEKEL